MTAIDVVVRVIDALDRLAIPYITVVQRRNLNLDYIRAWCDQHDTRALFEQLLQESRLFEGEQP